LEENEDKIEGLKVFF